MVLKSVILHQSMIVAYAGDVVRAHIALQKWRRSWDVDTTVQALLAAHCEQGLMDPDFIIASGSPNPSIVRIRAGDIEHGLSAAWLGDAETFGAFQKLRITADAKDGPWEQACYAFNSILHDEQYPLVSGFMVESRCGGGQSRYLPHMGVTYDPEAKVVSTEFERLPQRTAAEGGYSYYLLTPSESGVGVIGVFFPQGNVGYLFHPRRTEVPFNVPASSVQEFVGEVRRRWALSLSPPPFLFG